MNKENPDWYDRGRGDGPGEVRGGTRVSGRWTVDCEGGPEGVGTKVELMDARYGRERRRGFTQSRHRFLFVPVPEKSDPRQSSVRGREKDDE